MTFSHSGPGDHSTPNALLFQIKASGYLVSQSSKAKASRYPLSPKLKTPEVSGNHWRADWEHRAQAKMFVINYLWRGFNGWVKVYNGMAVHPLEN